jgi:hypothetical protein
MLGVSLISTWKQAVKGPKDASIIAYLPALARGEREFRRLDCNVKQLGITGFSV